MIREEAEAGLTAEDLIEADDIDLSVFDSLAAPSLRTVPAALHASQASRTTKTASPSTPKPPRAARIAQLIEESRTLVDRVLLSIPDSRVTARRYLSDRLWTAPRAEEFQEILKMVEEEHSTGITAESGRRAIALRCVAETILREFWEASPSDPAEILRLGVEIEEIIETAEAITDAPRPLLPRRETLRGPTILAPRIAALFTSIAEPNPAGPSTEVLLPSLTEVEHRVLDVVVAGDELSPWHRTCAEVAALRAAIHECSVEADVTSAAGEVRAQDQPPTEERETMAPSPEEESGRRLVLEKLQDLRLAYRAVSDRLQAQQDLAMRNRDTELSETLTQFRRPLLNSYAVLMSAIQRLTPAGEEMLYLTSDAIIDPDAATAATAATAAESYAGETVKDVFNRAVDGKKKPAVRARDAAARVSRAANSRKAAFLYGLLGTLAAGAIAVHVALPPPPPEPLGATTGDYATVIELVSAQPFGVMLYCQATAAWSTLPEQVRMNRVVALAQLAQQHGFKSLYLVDADREPAAEWDPVRGSRLLSSTPITASAAGQPKNSERP